MNVRTVGVMSVPVIDLAATGRNIKNLRVSAGISVRDLQMILGFTNPQAIYKWQNGDSMPSIDNLVILAAVLGVTVDEILVTDSDPPDDGEVILTGSENTTIEYLPVLLIQLGAEGFTTCRGAMDFSASIPRDTLGEELPHVSDGMRGGRNCQQKSCGTV